MEDKIVGRTGLRPPAEAVSGEKFQIGSEGAYVTRRYSGWAPTVDDERRNEARDKGPRQLSKGSLGAWEIRFGTQASVAQPGGHLKPKEQPSQI